MTGQLVNLLIATAVVPLSGTISVLLALWLGQRRWCHLLAGSGICGGAICSLVMAAILAGRRDDSATIQVMLWDWFAFSAPNSPSISFGLEATMIKASLVGICGILAFVALWQGRSSAPHRLSDDAILATSFLYTAGVGFVLAPNLAQSLLSWGAISVAARILVRLAHSQDESVREPGAALVGGNRKAVSSSQLALQLLSAFVRGAEQGMEKIRAVCVTLVPGWISDQLEFLEESSSSIHVLAALLGMSAILLTWMLNQSR